MVMWAKVKNAVTLSTCALALGMAACGFSPWPDRQDEEVSGLVTDAPTWAQGERRFVLPGDSLTVKIDGIRVGYACTQITEAGLVVSAEHSGAGVAAFEPFLKALMPGIPECPVQNERDTVLGWRVSANAGLALRLVDKEGNVGDMAWVVAGNRLLDSLVYVKEATGLITVESGLGSPGARVVYTYRDSSLLGSGMLYADSLPPCTYLNRVLASKSGDTTWVRIEAMDLEPETSQGMDGVVDSAFTCTTDLHQDSLAVQSSF
jgi:hypothetical protein